MRRSVRRSSRRVSRNTRRSTRRSARRSTRRRSARRTARRSARRSTRRRSTKRRSNRRSTRRRSTKRRSTRRRRSRRHHMKGGGLYGTPAAPASIAIPVAAAAVGTTAAVALGGAYYKHVPKTTRKNIVKALEKMKELLETPNEGYQPDMVLRDSHNLERIGRLIKGAVSVEEADADEENDNEDKLPSVLRRHFTKVGEEEVDNLFPLTDDGKSNELRGIFLKSLKPKSGLVSGLVAEGYLKHGTTNVPARLGYGTGSKEESWGVAATSDLSGMRRQKFDIIDKLRDQVTQAGLFEDYENLLNALPNDPKNIDLDAHIKQLEDLLQTKQSK